MSNAGDPPRSPLTGNPGTLVRSLDVAATAKRWREELRTAPGAAFENARAVTLWRDGANGFEWYEPSCVAGDGELYTALSQHEWYYDPNRWDFGAALRKLKPGQKVLEVGSGAGHFLRSARDAGLTVEGHELNLDAAERNRKDGFIMHEGPLPTSGDFDAVCSFQVLEHISDPREFLVEQIKTVKKGGLLIAAVPNAATMRFADPGWRNLLDEPPHHMSHWYPRTMQSLSEILPIKLLDIVYEPLALHHIDWWVSGALNRMASRLSPASVLFQSWKVRKLSASILSLGARAMVRGHTMMATFTRAA